MKIAFSKLRSLLFLIPALFIIPALAFAQSPDTVRQVVHDTVATAVTASTSLLTLGTILSIIVPVINGKLTELLVNALKSINAFANATAWIKQTVALVSASLLALAVAFLGVHVAGTDLGTLTAGDVGVLVNAGLAFLIARVSHNEKKTATVTITGNAPSVS